MWEELSIRFEFLMYYDNFRMEVDNAACKV
jgi:hypothetical protein